MKISVKQYAKALLEATEGKNAADARPVIKKFAQVLFKNNDESKLNDICSYFSMIYDKRDGLVEADIISARELNKETIDSLKKYLKEQTGAEKLSVSEDVDKTLLGGVILKYGDKIVDLSLKNKLEQLKNNLNK